MELNGQVMRSEVIVSGKRALLISLMTTVMAFQPVLAGTAMAEEVVVKAVQQEKAIKAEPDTVVVQEQGVITNEKKRLTAEPQVTKTESWSTTTKVGIAVGAAAVVGIAIAAGGGSSSSGDSASTEPPTSDQLVGAWTASASSVESHSYTGTYQLYANSAESYDLLMNSGYRKTGGGRWVIDGYRLSLYNDTGTVYSGEFTPGNYNEITLGTTVGWTLHLTR